MSRVRTIWRLLNLPCEGMSRLASRSLDCDLGSMERIALRLHLLYCAACRRYQQQLMHIRSAVRALADSPSGAPGLPDEARERIKRALKRS
jgi:hypothetical protein